MRDFYIRDLGEFKREPGYLTDTLGFAQDKFVASYMPLIKNYEKAVQLIDSQNG